MHAAKEWNGWMKEALLPTTAMLEILKLQSAGPLTTHTHTERDILSARKKSILRGNFLSFSLKNVHFLRAETNNGLQLLHSHRNHHHPMMIMMTRHPPPISIRRKMKIIFLIKIFPYLAATTNFQNSFFFYRKRDFLAGRCPAFPSLIYESSAL